jgi:chromosome segregation ATPase
MDLLDRIDEAHRRQGISDYVDSLPLDNHISERDAQMLLDELNTIDSNGFYGNSAPHLEVKIALKQPLRETNSISSTPLGKSRPELQALSLLSREDGETVRRLMNELHLQQVDNQSLNLRINHLQLQNEALFNSEQEHKHELDQALFVIATLEQDMLLLKTKLRDVAGFEQNRDDHVMEEIRGKLLQLSSERCEEFVKSMDSLQRENDEKSRQYEQHVQDLEVENQALVHKLEELSTEIAQRAVLYAAQERRMMDTLTTHNYEAQGKVKQLVEVQAKLEQLQSMYDKLSHEHTELTIQQRSLSSNKEDLVLQLEELQEQLQMANSDMAEMATQNKSLETMISHLRGSDADGMELNILQEIEKVRHQARIREESLRVQLSEACEQLEMASSSRDTLAQERERLRQENEDFRRLLHNLEMMGLSHSDFNLSMHSSNYQLHDTSRMNLTMESLLLGQEDEDDESAAVVVDDGTNATVDEDAGSLTWLVSPSRAADQQEQGDRLNESSTKSTYVLSKLIRQLKDVKTEDITHLRAVITRVLHDQLAISESEGALLIEGLMQLLTNRVSVADDTASIASGYEERIRDMKKEMKQLKHILKKVLASAAEMGVTGDANEPANRVANSSVDENRIKALTDAVEVLTKEKEQLEEHLRHYRHEIQQLEDMIQSSKEIGRHEASMELEARILQTESSCKHFKDLTQTLQAKLEKQENSQQEVQGRMEMFQRQLESDKLAIAVYILERDNADKRVQELQQDLTNAQEEHRDLLQRYEALITRVASTSSGKIQEGNAMNASVGEEEETQTESDIAKIGVVLSAESQNDPVTKEGSIADRQQIVQQIQMIEGLESALKMKQEEIEQLQHSLQQSASKMSILRNDFVTSENEGQVMRSEIQIFKEKNQHLQSQLITARLEIDKVQSDLHTARVESLELHQKLQLKDSEFHQLHVSLHTSDSKLIDSAEQQHSRDSHLEQFMAAKEQEYARLQVEILKQNSEIQRLQGEVFGKETELQTLQLEYNASKDKIAELIYQKEEFEKLQALLLHEKQGLVDEIAFLQGQLREQAAFERERAGSNVMVGTVNREARCPDQVEEGVVTDWMMMTTRDVVVIDTREQRHQQDTHFQQIHNLETEIRSLQDELRLQQQKQQLQQQEQRARAKTPERAYAPKKDAKEQDYIEELESQFKQSNSLVDMLRLENERLLDAQASLQDKLQCVNSALQVAEVTHKQELQILTKQWESERTEMSTSLLGLQHNLQQLSAQLESSQLEHASQEQQFRTFLLPIEQMGHRLLLSIAPATLASENVPPTDAQASSAAILLQSIERSLRSASSHFAQLQEHQKQTLLDAKGIVKALEEELAKERLASERKEAKHKSALQQLMGIVSTVSILITIRCSIFDLSSSYSSIVPVLFSFFFLFFWQMYLDKCSL